MRIHAMVLESSHLRFAVRWLSFPRRPFGWISVAVTSPRSVFIAQEKLQGGEEKFGQPRGFPNTPFLVAVDEHLPTHRARNSVDPRTKIVDRFSKMGSTGLVLRHHLAAANTVLPSSRTSVIPYLVVSPRCTRVAPRAA